MYAMYLIYIHIHNFTLSPDFYFSLPTQIITHIFNIIFSSKYFLVKIFNPWVFGSVLLCYLISFFLPCITVAPYNWFLSFFLNLSVVDLEYWVSFWCTAKWFRHIISQCIFPLQLLWASDYSSLSYTIGPCYLFYI